jgi:Mrp family chromosome partitioning ATPase
MLERFRKPGYRTRRHRDDDDGVLPFDLELTRRVTGEYMPARWGSGDPVEAGLPAPRRGTSLVPFETAEWEGIPRASFGQGAATALHAQMQIAGGDKRVIRVFDDLRTQLLQTLQVEVWSRVAITAPTYGCGATFTAVQLALGISRVPDCRTILLDLNQRQPGVARQMGVRAPGDIRALLAGRARPEDHLLRLSDTLAVGLNDVRAANAADVLHSKRTAEQLEMMTDALCPDVVLHDLPPMLEHDDVEAFLPQVDGVLIVADAGRTTARELAECERRLAGKSNLLGVILNRTRPRWPAARAA